jgi:hypothetical protein
MFQICQEEKVYRTLEVSRDEVIRILTDESYGDVPDGLSDMDDAALGRALKAAVDSGDIANYLESEVVETDSSSPEWSVRLY